MTFDLSNLPVMIKFFKKLSVLGIAFLLLVQVALAQKQDTTSLSSSTKSYNLYMQRHKTFKTLGWVLLVSGTVMTATGVAIVSKGDFFSTTDNSGFILGTAGSVMMLGSIPCFILSGSNVRKAALELRTSTVPGPGGFHYAAVGVKLSF